jgi:hypothetical protein
MSTLCRRIFQFIRCLCCKSFGAATKVKLRESVFQAQGCFFGRLGARVDLKNPVCTSSGPHSCIVVLDRGREPCATLHP